MQLHLESKLDYTLPECKFHIDSFHSTYRKGKVSMDKQRDGLLLYICECEYVPL